MGHEGQPNVNRECSAGKGFVFFALVLLLQNFYAGKWCYSSTCKCKCNTVKLFPSTRIHRRYTKLSPHGIFPVYGSLVATMQLYIHYGYTI